MTPEQFQRVRDLFEQALQEEPWDMERWLEERGVVDDEVRAEVATLFNCNSRAGSFLSEPAARRAPSLLADETAFEPGATLAPYRIERELGRGGMGHVYLATDMRLGRTVALKALPPRLTRDEPTRERLRREARAAAALSHPGICTVFALEELDGDLYIASEYVEGHTLREETAAGKRPSAAEVRDAARQLAEALAAAHAKSITHRDLKPENIMRGVDGRLRILDFGLARFDSSSDDTRHVTEPGSIVGTPAYMAPEQLNGQPADARTDVFALGVVLYEYACGVHPFAAANPISMAARVLHSDVAPLDARCPALPPELVGIIDRCLQKSPADRFASAGEIVSALARDDRAPKRGAAAAWWRRHQLAMIGLYFLASSSAWQIKEWRHGPADVIFLFVGVASTAAAILRGHLVFTERTRHAGFHAHRQRVRPFVLGLDLSLALALTIDGTVAYATRPLVAVLVIALAVGIALVSLVVEPTTTEAAFP